MEVLIPCLILALIGGALGFGIGVVAKKFALKQDSRFPIVRDALPGANCGGCGYAGCDAYAKAIVNEGADINLCSVGGNEASKRIAAAMGMEASAAIERVAFVACGGNDDVAKDKLRYTGVTHCLEAMMIPGQGPKACTYGCLGFGTCVHECPFDAIHIVNGIAEVDRERCVGCGKCVMVCPKKIISLVPKDQKTLVNCSCREKGREVRVACEVGCIGCGLCARNCEAGAITIDGNLAKIDYTKCNHCGCCIEKCPSKCLKFIAT